MHKYFLLGLFTSTAFYGIVAALVCVLWLDVGASSIVHAAGEHVGLTGWFCAYMAVAPLAYIALRGLDLALMRREGRSIAPVWLIVDIVNPFRGLVALVGMRDVIDTSGLAKAGSWATQVLHLVWAIALLLWLAVGIGSVAIWGVPK